MPPRGQVVNIVGGKEARAAFRAAGGKPLLDAVRDARKQVAQAVVDEALPHVPVGRTRRLRGTVKALASQTTSRAQAGTKTVDYAAAIHYGRKKRGLIVGRLFLWDAASKVRDNGKAAAVFKARLDVMFRNLFGG